MFRTEKAWRKRDDIAVTIGQTAEGRVAAECGTLTLIPVIAEEETVGEIVAWMAEPVLERGGENDSHGWRSLPWRGAALLHGWRSYVWEKTEKTEKIQQYVWRKRERIEAAEGAEYALRLLRMDFCAWAAAGGMPGKVRRQREYSMLETRMSE